MRLSDIASFLGTQASGEAQVTGMSLSTSHLKPGDLFIALAGEKTHGIRFLEEAIERGAVAVLTDGAQDVQGIPSIKVDQPRALLGELSSWFYGDPSQQMSVIGVTGTNGKTTTAYLVEAACRGAGFTTGLIGTVETRIAGEVRSSVRTTPEAPELQALFGEMRERNVTHVAMEVSSHALALGRVAGTRFAAAGFTNLSQDHLDFHGDMETYFQAKAELFRGEYAANALINVDDAYGKRLISETSIPTLAVSTSGPADWFATDIDCRAELSRAVFVDPFGRRFPVSLRITGRYNVDNALMAVSLVSASGVDTGAAIAGIEALDGVPGRLERVDAGQDFAVFVDYAHTPDAVRRVLHEVRAMTTGRVIGVLGCGGDRDAGKRPLMGQALASGSDVAILTSDNPRSEDPIEILRAMEQGARAVPNSHIMVEADRRTAIEQAITMAQVGDSIVIAGKGHEQGQEVNGAITPFDDRHVARDLLVKT